MTDILDTVKAALEDGTFLSRDIEDIVGDVGALVAEVERLREEVGVASSLYHTTKDQLARSDADLAALRQRHAETVEKAYREGLREPSGDPDEYSLSDDELWLTSEAKARLT